MKYHRTARARDTMSAPLRSIIRYYGKRLEGPFYDHGCGRGADVRALQQLGDVAFGWDPNGGPVGEPPEALPRTVLCTYVLNVVHDREERARIIRAALNRLDTTRIGRAFFTVRRDIPEEGTPTQSWVTADEIFEVAKRWDRWALCDVICKNRAYCIVEIEVLP